jgi:nicotinamidase-related amidase
MATIRSGNRSALVVVDVQVGVMASSWEASRVVANLARAVEHARSSGVPVVWVQHESDELPRDSASWQLVPELQPRSGEKRVYKRFPSSFEGTDLESSLHDQGTTHVVLAGAQTNWCIRATAYAALDRGYDLTLVKDAHTTESIDLGDGKVIEASSMVTDLNIAMKWLSYPGRKNSTAATDELSFAVAT